MNFLFDISRYFRFEKKSINKHSQQLNCWQENANKNSAEILIKAHENAEQICNPTKNLNSQNIPNWEKMDGLLPAIVQDAKTNTVLMLGYMNQKALEKTISTKWVTFYSRSKKRLWTKGEVSGNKLEFVRVMLDCDNDALLIYANPTGPVCHLGYANCFGTSNQTDWDVINRLEKTITERSSTRPSNSYTAKLLDAGISRMAQKVGEEGVEVALAAIEKNDAAFCGEIADLLFHVLVLLKARNLNISCIIDVLKKRENKNCEH